MLKKVSFEILLCEYRSYGLAYTRGGQTFCMKGRIGKNFKAEGRTALEKESNKGHHQWRTHGFGKEGRGTPPEAWG